MSIRRSRLLSISPWLVPALIVCGTVEAWRSLARQVRHEDEQHFARLQQTHEALIARRLSAYEEILWGAAGLIHASEHVSRAEWGRYVSTLQIEARSPGLRAIGYVAVVPRPGLEAFVVAARADGAPNFSVRPPGERPVYLPVLYTEPRARNATFLGYDIAAEPRWQTAAEAARDTGEPRITPQVDLVEDDGTHSGFLLFLPVYDGASADTPEARRAAISGWVYAAFAADELMAGVVDTAPEVAWDIYDDVSPSISALIFGGRLERRMAGTEAPPTLNAHHTLTFAGRSWRVEWTDTAAFQRSSARHEPWVVLLLGSLIAALLTGLILAFKRTGERAEALAHWMTEAFAGSEARFRSLVESAGAGIVIADGQGKIVQWNEGARALFGYDADEVIGQSFSLLMSEPLRAPSEAWLRAAGEDEFRGLKGRTKAISVRRKGGEEFPVELSLATWQNGSERFWSGIIIDVTERTAALRALGESESLFRTLATCAPVGIFRTDGAGQCVFVNDRWAEMTGMRPEQALGNGWTEGLHPDDQERFMAEWKAALATQSEFNCEYRYRNPDGIERWVSGRSIAIRSASGEVVSHLGTTMDITGRVRAQQALLEAKNAAEEAARAKGDFLAMMSHEIRTPMNGVIGMLQVHLDSALSSAQRDEVNLALRSAEGLLALLNNILDLSRIESRRLELETVSFAPAEIAEDVVRLFAEAAKQKGLRLRLERQLPALAERLRLLGDAGRYRQVLMNLVANAIKFTEAGEVVVQVAVLDSAPAPLSALLRTSVADTGIGIPGEAQRRLFEPFSQAERSTSRRFGGSGLGLAICKQLVQAMGGHIGVESTPGRGSRFHFELTLEKSLAVAVTAAPAQPPAARGQEEPARPERILLVEDNAVNRRVALHFCRKLGFQADVAESGEDALAQTLRTPYQLILMDCHMPDMDGLAVTRAIRARGGAQQPPIVALTAAAMSDDREQCLAAGMNDYLTKPLALTALRSTLDRWLPG